MKERVKTGSNDGRSKDIRKERKKGHKEGEEGRT